MKKVTTKGTSKGKKTQKPTPDLKKIFVNFLSGKTQDGKAFACQVNLIPTEGELPDEFWSALVDTLVDVQIMTEEELNG
jgi:hypothetical protein